MYEDLNLDVITKAINEFRFDKHQRSPEHHYKIRTGTGGYDLFDETIDRSLGFDRLYIGKKVLRILRIKKLQPKKSLTKGWYYLVKQK